MGVASGSEVRLNELLLTDGTPSLSSADIHLPSPDSPLLKVEQTIRETNQSKLDIGFIQWKKTKPPFLSGLPVKPLPQ